MSHSITADQNSRQPSTSESSTFLPRPKRSAAKISVSANASTFSPRKAGSGSATPASGALVAGGATLTVPWKQRQIADTPGTVSQLKPGISVAVLLKQEARVSDAVLAMAERRSDCVLVTDVEGNLCGILTDKDIVYKVVAQGLDPRTVCIKDTMTKNPTSVFENTLLTEALALMVNGKFRHLPVTVSKSADSQHAGTDIGGILDIVKCTWEALNKLDKVLEGSKKLQDALDIFKNDIGGNNPVVGAQDQLRALAEKLSNDATMTTLHQAIFEKGLDYPPVPYTTKIKEIAQLLKKYRTTGILVKDASTLKGIFTTKDIVFKVLKNGMDPSTTSVVRFMTKSPETIGSDQTVLDALRKMHSGGFFHLPVVDHLSNNEIVGIVNVLQLTYYVTKQLPTILGQGDSCSNRLFTQLMGTFTGPNFKSDSKGCSNLGYTPDNDDASSLASSAHGGQHGIPNSIMLPVGWSEASVGYSAGQDNATGGTVSASPFAVDVFNFKLRDSKTGQVFRFTSRTNTLKTLLLTIAEKLGLLLNFSSNYGSKKVDLETAKMDSGLDLNGDADADLSSFDILLNGMTVYYEDDEGDTVLLGNDHDLMEALHLAQRLGWSKISLIYQSDNPRSSDYETGLAESVDLEHQTKSGYPKFPFNLNLTHAGVIAGAFAVAAVVAFRFAKS